MPPGLLAKLPRMDEAESTHKTRRLCWHAGTPKQARGTRALSRLLRTDGQGGVVDA